MVYIDDILVTGATDREHLQNLQEVLTHLEKAGIRLKKDKCAFMLAVVEAPVPKNVTQLRYFFRTSQLLRQLHAKPVKCSRPIEPAIAEVQEVVLGKCPIKGIPGSKGSPHFSDVTNALQS